MIFSIIDYKITQDNIFTFYVWINEIRSPLVYSIVSHHRFMDF